MWLFAKCIEATRAPGFVYAQHRTDGVYHRAGHVRRYGGHDAGIAVTFPESLRSRSPESSTTFPESLVTLDRNTHSLRRWGALTRFLDDGQLPIDNNWIENQIRPIAIGRNNWLFAGSLRAGQRAAAVMSLIQSAKLNGHDPNTYMKDLLQRLPTQRASQVGELLPHRWQPTLIVA